MDRSFAVSHAPEIILRVIATERDGIAGVPLIRVLLQGRFIGIDRRGLLTELGVNDPEVVMALGEIVVLGERAKELSLGLPKEWF